MQSAHEHLLGPLHLAVALTATSPKPYSAPPHLRLLNDELVQLWKREKDWPRNLMVFMPPGHAKSETCSHWFPVWNLSLEPATRIIETSYEADFAKKWGTDARRTVEEHFPTIGVSLMEDSRAGNRWETKEHGGMVTAGVGGPIMGRRADVLIVDDPIKNAEEAASPTIKKAIYEWLNTTLMTRRDSPDTICVLIMTRWATDDLAGAILASETANEWRVLRLPGLAEEDDPLGRAPGEALWPGKFDEDFLSGEIRRLGTAAGNALIQQRPTPIEGFAINPEWWQWYDEVPDELDDVILTWDTTFKDVATADFVCGGAWGRKGNKYYLLDCVHRRMGISATIKEIRAMNARWRQARKILIEETANGAAIIQLLHHELKHILPMPAHGSKTVRLHWQVNSVAGLIEDKRVYLPRAARYSKELVQEFRDFPLAPNDDYVDMTTQGLNYLQPRGWSYEAREAKAEVPPNSQLELESRRMHRKIKAKMKEREKVSPQHVWPGAR